MGISKFNETINKISDLIYRNWGAEHPSLGTITDWFLSDSKFEGDNYESIYTYNEDGMFYLLRELMNWDFFWATDKGKIDVENANEPEIAVLLAPFAKEETVLRVMDTFNC